MPIDLYPNIAKVKRNGVYQNLPGFVPQSGDSDIEAMIANKENSTTAQFSHPKDSYFILNDTLYQADADIPVNGTIAVGTNCHVAVMGNDVSQLIKDVASHTEKIDILGTEQPHITNNILNPFIDNFPYKNKYLKNKQGQLATSAGWNTTDFIPIEAGAVYEVTHYPSSGYFVVFYDANKTGLTYLSGYTSSILDIPLVGVNNTIWSYMRISLNTQYNDTKILKGSNSEVYLGEEAIKSTGLYVEVGAGKEYTTLREAFEHATWSPNSTIVVYPGVYDLAQEFSDRIASGNSKGIALKNGVHAIFLPGSYVKCLLDNTVASHEEFEPFYIQHDQYPFNGSFILEGLDIECSNTRYCVHDEMVQHAVPYVHKYINCRMKYSNTYSTKHYIQCIGGGLGVNGFIDIDGGYYYGVDSTVSGTGGQVPISYHNSYNANADSKIFIKNVYLAGETAHLRFGYYGTSTKVTPICVSGCSFGAAIEKRAENETALVDNFSITEWNNTIRT